MILIIRVETSQHHNLLRLEVKGRGGRVLKVNSILANLESLFLIPIYAYKRQGAGIGRSYHKILVTIDPNYRVRISIFEFYK